MFKQLMFDLEAEVFGYYKDWAASTTLDKMYKIVIEKKRGWGYFIPDRRRYEVTQYLLVFYYFLSSYYYRYDNGYGYG